MRHFYQKPWRNKDRMSTLMWAIDQSETPHLFDHHPKEQPKHQPHVIQHPPNSLQFECDQRLATQAIPNTHKYLETSHYTHSPARMNATKLFDCGCASRAPFFTTGEFHRHIGDQGCNFSRNSRIETPLTVCWWWWQWSAVAMIWGRRAGVVAQCAPSPCSP